MQAAGSSVANNPQYFQWQIAICAFIRLCAAHARRLPGRCTGWANQYRKQHFPWNSDYGHAIVPEYALDAQNTGAVVEGVASSPARVEVRQSGALIYSTLVPAGPFSLSALPLMNQ